MSLSDLLVGQPATLDLGEEAIDCRVEGLESPEVTLAPESAADTGYIPSLGREAVLVYEAGGGRVRTGGTVRRSERAGSLRFAAGSGDVPPRRRAPRIAAGLAVELAVLGENGAAGATRRYRTSDVSLGGLGVRVGEPALAVGARVAFTLELPGPSAISGTARVLRTDGDVAGLELVRITPADRARLAAFLLAGRLAG